MLRTAAATRLVARRCSQTIFESSAKSLPAGFYPFLGVREEASSSFANRGSFVRALYALSKGQFAAEPATLELSKEILEKYGHVTGLEREEIEGRLQGKERFETAPPRGHFGTKENPFLVESHFESRIVGCSGGIDEEEHDVVWFNLNKGETKDCSVCGQVFQLKTIGDGSSHSH